jgi:glycosyltransferase involved in cell wall biosynthesis
MRVGRVHPKLPNMLTVLLATRNRATILRDCLESFCNLQSPSSGWKVVIVDNGSTDQTAQIIASFASRLPLQSVYEPKAGKNNALNAAFHLLEGDLAVLTDDDVFPYPDWLVQLRKAADIHVSYSIFGGAVLPRWEAPPPSWVQLLELGPVYTLTDPSLAEGPMNPYLVFGPNMAVRTHAFRSGVRLDPSVGPRDSSYAMGGETDFVVRLTGQGHKAWHVPGAVVEHFIRKEQLKSSWIRKRAVRYGRGFYRMFCLHQLDNAKLWIGVPRHLFRDILEEGLHLGTSFLRLDREAAFRSSWQLNFLIGHAIEARALTTGRIARPKSATSIG